MLSDVDDNFILFMKIRMESCSRFGSKNKTNIFECCFLVYASTNTYINGFFFVRTTFFGLDEYGLFSRESQVNGPKEKIISLPF